MTTATSASPTRGSGRSVIPTASRDLLLAALRGLADAGMTTRASDRYVAAHLAALRAAAAVVAARAKPASRRTRLRSVWALLADVAPELKEWAEFFAAGARTRAAAEAGIAAAVTERAADDLMRDAESFIELVATTLGIDQQLGLNQLGLNQQFSFDVRAIRTAS